MLGGFAVILTMGWFLGTIGASIPGFKNFGGPAILSLLVPSILVFFNLINKNVLESTNMLMKQANFLYFYIACLVSGSILGMNRKMLIQGLLRMIFAGFSIRMLFKYCFNSSISHSLFSFIAVDEGA